MCIKRDAVVYYMETTITEPMRVACSLHSLRLFFCLLPCSFNLIHLHFFPNLLLIQPSIKSPFFIPKPRKPRLLRPLLFPLSLSSLQVLAPNPLLRVLLLCFAKHAISSFTQYSYCQCRGKVKGLRQTMRGQQGFSAFRGGEGGGCVCVSSLMCLC